VLYQVKGLAQAMGALGAAVFCVHLAAAAVQRVPAVILFEGARLVDGTGRAPIENSAILVENGTISRVGTTGQIPLPRGGQRVDLTGKTVIPGLVLLHGHVGYLSGTTFSADN